MFSFVRRRSRAPCQLRVFVLTACRVVAFYNGQEQEREASQKSFESLYWRMRSLFKRSFYLTWFLYFQVNATTAFGTLIVALLVVTTGSLDGQPVTAGNSQTALNGIISLITGLSTLPVYFSLLGELAGITHRCSQLVEALDELQV